MHISNNFITEHVQAVSQTSPSTLVYPMAHIPALIPELQRPILNLYMKEMMGVPSNKKYWNLNLSDLISIMPNPLDGITVLRNI